jgi:hypothetical protein
MAPRLSPELEKKLHELHKFAALQRTPSEASARKHKIHRSDYGALTNTSYYRKQKVAQDTLVTRTATVVDYANAAVKRDANASTPIYQRNNPLIINGRIVK